MVVFGLLLGGICIICVTDTIIIILEHRRIKTDIKVLTKRNKIIHSLED